MSRLGAEAIHLEFLDAIYRHNDDGQPFYKSTTVGISPNPEDESHLLPLLHAKFDAMKKETSSPASAVVAPLGLGSHVDHVLVRKAVEAAWDQTQIVYCEDYPYAGRMRSAGESWQGMHPVNSLNSMTLELDPDEITLPGDSDQLRSDHGEWRTSRQ